MTSVAGNPINQNPIPHASITSRQPNVSIDATRIGRVIPPIAENDISTARARARFRINQLATVATNTMNVPNDIPRVSNAMAM